MLKHKTDNKFLRHAFLMPVGLEPYIEGLAREYDLIGWEYLANVCVAQPNRALGYEPRGWGFDSLHGLHIWREYGIFADTDWDTKTPDAKREARLP